MKNQLRQSLVLTLAVIGFLLVFSTLNNLINNPLGLKKIDLLADIHPDKKDSITQPADSILVVEKKDSVITITPPPNPKIGSVYLEDYSKDKNVLQPFIESLRETETRPIRIAFFGDSFIEGDILCGNVRETLQSRYGGSGVGYVPMASEVAQFRMTIRHTYEQWETYSIVGKKATHAPLGFSGYCFIPQADNLVRFNKPGKAYKGFDEFRMFYVNRSPKALTYVLNDTLQQEVNLMVSDSLRQISIPMHNASSVDLKFMNPDSLLVYGGSFESGPGIYVDNFAMRGNSGMGLSTLSDQNLKQFNRFQDYKLILLQYGLNVVGEKDSLGYSWYTEKMVKVIQRLRQVLPEASIVLIGVSDRSSNQDGTITTIPAIPRMRDAQRKIAIKSEIAFWDLYSAMGGKDTMVKFVAANPPLGAKDYTHLTYLGGKKIAALLTDALLHELKKNDKKSNP
jgi:hypothetical protein